MDTDKLSAVCSSMAPTYCCMCIYELCILWEIVQIVSSSKENRKQGGKDISSIYHTLAFSVESRRLTVETLSSFIPERRISGMKSKTTFQMLSEDVKAIFILKHFSEFTPISLRCHTIYFTVILRMNQKAAVRVQNDDMSITIVTNM